MDNRGHRQGRDDDTFEVVDIGSTNRPWLAYAVLALLVLAAGAFGLHRLAAPPAGAAPSRSTAPRQTATAAATSSRSTGSGPVGHLFAQPRARATGPAIAYGSAEATRLAADEACRRTGLVLALLPSAGPQARRPQTLISSCQRRDYAPAGQSVVVRAPDGEYGRHSAVVTYPYLVPADEQRGVTTIRGVHGRWNPTSVTWTVHGLALEVAGDLPRAQLARIALATHIRGPRLARVLQVGKVAGLQVGPVRRAAGAGVSGASYPGHLAGLVESADPAGLTLTVTGGTGSEAQLFQTPRPIIRRREDVRGYPGVLYADGHGGLALDWLLPPDDTASLRCERCADSSRTEAALVRLAQHTELYALSTPMEQSGLEQTGTGASTSASPHAGGSGR